MTELKPCPFCGAKNTDDEFYPLMIEHNPKTILHPAYRVLCDNCGATSGWSDRGNHTEKWNTRPPATDEGDEG